MNIKEARSIQRAAVSHLKVRTATKEIHRSVDLLGEALDELEKQEQQLAELRKTMTY